MLLLVSRLPAIGDLGQELADIFDFFFRPCVQAGTANREDFRGWNLSCFDVPAERHRVNAELSSSLVRREGYHYSML